MPVDDVCRVIVLNELTAVIEIEKGVVIEQHYIRRFSVLYKLIVHVKPLLSSAEQMDQTEKEGIQSRIRCPLILLEIHFIQYYEQHREQNESKQHYQQYQNRKRQILQYEICGSRTYQVCTDNVRYDSGKYSEDILSVWKFLPASVIADRTKRYHRHYEQYIHEKDRTALLLLSRSHLIYPGLSHLGAPAAETEKAYQYVNDRRSEAYSELTKEH